MFFLFACAPEHLDAADTWESDLDALEDPAPVPDRVGWCDFRPDLAFEDAAAVANIGRIHAPGGTDFAWPLVDADADGQNLDFEITDGLVLGMQALGMQQWVTLSTHKVDTLELAPIRLPDDTTGWSLFVQGLVERYDGDGVDDMPGLLWPVVA